jgi:hypothetical protein
MPNPVYKNRLLAMLDCATLARLQLHPADLPVGHEMECPGKHIDHLFFLEDGIAAMTVTFQDGAQAEVVLGGTETVLGATPPAHARRP